MRAEFIWMRDISRPVCALLLGYSVWLSLGASRVLVCVWVSSYVRLRVRDECCCVRVDNVYFDVDISVWASVWFGELMTRRMARSCILSCTTTLTRTSISTLAATLFQTSHVSVFWGCKVVYYIEITEYSVEGQASHSDERYLLLKEKINYKSPN